MLDTMISNCFYSDKVIQFTYFRISRQLITDPRFKQVSTDSKLLCGMLLNRMGLSIKSEWYNNDLYLLNRRRDLRQSALQKRQSYEAVCRT